LSPEVYNNIPHDMGVLNYLSQILQQYGKDAYDGVLTSFANSVDFAFLIGGMIMLLLVFVGLFIKAKKNREIELTLEEDKLLEK
jgi:hypothetical protein